MTIAAKHTSRKSLDPFLGTDEVAAYFNYSTSHFRHLVRMGKFPKPVRISGRKLAWRQSVIDEYSAGLVRDAQAA